jgi:glycosyltransferase involved in cell wall biosynthesis
MSQALAKTIQVFSPFFPHPRNEGAHLAISEQVRRFCELGYAVQLIYWKGPTPSNEVLESDFAGVSTIRIGTEAKETKTAFRILKSLLSPWSSAELFHYPPELRPELDRLPPADLRLFHYSFAGPWLNGKRLSGKTAVIFHNLENELYRQRAASTPPGVAKWIHALNAKKLRTHERQVPSHCDELWFLSPKDLEDYKAQQGSPAQTPFRAFVPFFSEKFLKEKRSLRKPPSTQTIGFVGGLHFRPNQVSADWIVSELAPELQKLGFSGRLLIIGKEPPQDLILKAKAYPFIEVQGFVPNLDQYWSEVGLSLSPHLEGSGVRMKLLESLTAGIPVVTHRAALEQLSESLRKHPQLYTTDSPKEWAELIMKTSIAPQPTAEGDRALTSLPSWFNSLMVAQP